MDTGSYFNQSASAGAALRPTLGAMAKHALWPTPTVHGNHNAPKAGTDRGTGLSTAVKRWPTPTAQDSEQAGGKGMLLAGNRGLSLHQAVQPLFAEAVNTRNFPTPTAAAATQGRRSTDREGGEGQNLLEAVARAVARFPTPAARDHRHPNAESYEERGGGAKGEQLPNAIGGPLAPDWVELLMGWVMGWTSLEPLRPGWFEGWRNGFSGDGAPARASWRSGEWECGVPRTGVEIPERVSRIKCIGNGQVPITAATSFRLLAARFDGEAR